MGFDATEFRQRQRAVWSSGDWPDVAQTIQAVADQVVAEAEISDGTTVLDIGTGSGNVAIPAAQAGGKVTGVDVTPELFDAGRDRAKEAGVEVEWVEGDAADLPFEDDSFDRVLSCFGAMFAPIHQDAANEFARVTKPGGLFANCAWTPDSLNGRMLKMMGEAMPKPPPEVSSPIQWGDENHVRELFEGKDIELNFETRTAVLDVPGRDFKTAEEGLEYFEENLGPIIMAKGMLSEQGKWDETREKLLELYRESEGPDGYKPEADYVRTLGRKAG